MPDPILYLKAMGVAAGVSAIVMLTFGWFLRTASSIWMNLACVFAIGLSLVLGYFVLLGRPIWPPTNGLGRLLLIVFPAVIGIEVAAGFPRVPQWFAWTLRMSLATLIGRILLHGSVYLDPSRPEWKTGQIGVALALDSVLLAMVWWLLSWLSQRAPGVSIPLALAQASFCAGISVMLAGYVTGGAATFPVGAALVGAAFASTQITKFPGWQGTIGIGVVGLFSLLFIGMFFGRLSSGSAMAVLLSPILCWVPELPLLRCQKPWLVVSLRLMLAAIPLIVVLAQAIRDFDRELAPLLGEMSFSRRVETGMDKRSSIPMAPALC